MNIFDAHISGSLSVSASAEISGDLNILGGLNLRGNLSGSADFNSLRNVPTLVSGSSQLTSSYDNRYVLSGSITQTTWDNIASKPNGIVSGSSQVDVTSTTGYSTFSSSIATTDSNQNTRLGLLETASGSIRTTLNTYTSSNDTTNTTQNNRLTSIETSTGSLNTFTSSIDSTIKTKLNSEGVISGSSQVLGGTTIHSGSFFNGISVVSGSGQIDITSTTGYSTFSSSIATTDSNQSTKISGLETASGSIRTDFNTYTSSNDTTNTNQNGRLTSVESATGSLNTFTSSINTTIKTKLNTEGVISGSSQVLNSSGIWSGSAQLPSGVISGSSQLPSGLISGSSQVDITSTTGYVTFSSSIDRKSVV